MNLCDYIERHLAGPGGVSRQLWERALAGPAREFLRRPGKGLRGRLVEAAFGLAGGEALAGELPAALELLHAGSLVLDDIQDASLERRGGPTLHRVCGTPAAINTGNWMVFCSVQMISQASFPAAPAAAEAQRRTAAALVACHQGQALDLSLSVAELDPGEVAEVVAASTRLRTGSLTELAAALGGLAAGAGDRVLGELCALGRDLGVALQQLDDLGGIVAPARRPKGIEDLENGRPTWPWAWAAERAGATGFAALQSEARAVAGGSAAEPLRARLAGVVEELGRARARATLRRAWSRAVESFEPSPAREQLAADIELLETSYGYVRAAVVGSGFGGLAVAIRLQAAGFATTLFEARDKPGGRAYVYREGGFTFDAGPTVITAPDCLEEVCAAAGRRLADYVELLPVQPFYRLVWPDGDRFDYTGDQVAMAAEIGRRDPRDADGYRRFVEYSRRVFETGYQELAATPFLRFADMVRVAPHLARLRADRPVYATVSRFVRDQRTRQALSFHSLLVGGSPLETSSIYTLIHYLERKWGVFFPRGGTGALVAGLVRLFEELGGQLRLSCPVERIDLAAGGARPVHRVTSAAAASEPFDLVVSNADLHHTYASLYRREPAARRMRRRLEKMDWSMSLFVLYFGTDRSYADEVAHHTVMFGPRYEGLLRDIFGGSRLPDDFSLYLHAPTVTDPSMAPPGCGSFYVLSPVPHLGRAPVDWDKIAGSYGDRILAALEQVLPDLRRHVVVRRHFTPVDFKSELNSYLGSAFSCAPHLSQSAYFRPHNRDPRIPGLYLVGAGTHPGAGVPGVVNSAKATARLIVEDFA